MGWHWANGLSDTLAGLAKRAAGEFGRPDLVLEGEAQQAKGVAEMTETRLNVTGWKLDGRERKNLLKRFPPRYANPIANHVMLDAGAANNTPLPKPVQGEIVGHVDDWHGVEAMIVAINGSTQRPDGGTYHITWSLAFNRQAKESNDVIAEHGWTGLPERVAIRLEPAVFQ